MNNNNSGGGFAHGVLLGFILGGGLVFLLGTSKGKKLLKTITEEGLEGIADLEDLVEDETETAEYKKPIRSAKRVEVPLDIEEKEGGEESAVAHAPIEKVISTTRRLFKGIPRRN